MMAVRPAIPWFLLRTGYFRACFSAGFALFAAAQNFLVIFVCSMYTVTIIVTHHVIWRPISVTSFACGGRFMSRRILLVEENPAECAAQARDRVFPGLGVTWTPAWVEPPAA